MRGRRPAAIRRNQYFAGTVLAPSSRTGGSVTPEDISLVQESWRKVVPVKEAAARLFYMKLFELDPTMRGMFACDEGQQGKKFIQMTTAAVRGLDRLDALLPVVRDLGVRQAACGVHDEHYGTVAIALLWTLDQCLGKSFTPQVKSAWIKTYGVLSQNMNDAGRSWAA
jgi:hemoglobin-like flavoprotein